MRPTAMLADPGLATSSLLERYRAVRNLTVDLTRDLVPEDQVVQTMPDVSPTKWHLAHTTWFWETFVLTRHQPGYRLHDERYPFLFNSYYTQAGARHCRAQRGYVSRPTVNEVWEYRRAVDAAMERFLAGSGPGADGPVHELVELGLNHEQQHQELLVTDIKHVFSVNPLRPVFREGAAALPPPRSPDRNGTSPPSSAGEGSLWGDPVAPLLWRHVDEGVHTVGWTGEGFSYDNEGPAHRRLLQPFAIADRLVTCGEFLAFMEDGGYRRAELWMSAGWALVEQEGWSEPFYWERRDDEWWMFTLGGMRRVDPAEPVCHVNWYEADAYARWAGARLPREDEWEIVAAGNPIHGNLVESGRLHPSRAEAPPASSSQAPVLRQLFGDVWEWTASQYSPYPGYRPAPGAVGEYNGKFMVNQFVLRGGSCATSASHLRATYRNFFPPDASWQFSGIRLARDPIDFTDDTP